VFSRGCRHPFRYNAAMAERFFQDTIALVYDFDGTLSPQPMQEYTVLPKLGVEPAQFWAMVDRDARETQSDKMLVYMRHILEALERAKVDVKRADFAAMARAIEYFPGVASWFARMDGYVRRRSRGRVKLRHYLISAGQREILEGVSIRKHLQRIYASEYHFNHHGVATFPKFLVTDTMKTQFLFRINKGIEDITESINEHMPEAERPIPFQNIIYVGDGMTDVPSMALTKKNGGFAVAVYDARDRRGRATCVKLLNAGRVDYVAPADYRAGTALARRVELLLDAIVAGVAYRREAFECLRENARVGGDKPARTRARRRST
jgi:2-hydroxy-3-keto-5-methylthiopentenyl-1-phosphate phosphatase